MKQKPVIPPPLKKGSCIRLISPSGIVDKSRIEASAAILEKWGFDVIFGHSVFFRNGIFAGSDEERLSDLQKALDDPKTAAIICTRGGYGMSRMIDRVDFTGFKKHPKWILGFSDITVLHAAVNKQCNVCSLHGPVLNSFTTFGEDDATLSYVLNCLKGELPEYLLPAHPLNREGKSTGIFSGGNLSLLYNLRGTPNDINPKGKILFIEDIEEYHYHLDRMMMNLKSGGVLKQIAGLVCGGFTEMKDSDTPFGKNAEEIILEAVAEYDYPVLFGFPAGHIKPNYPLVMGCQATIYSDGDSAGLQFGR